MNKDEWWSGAVIYQIYPRSIMDSNNDGIGDLQGIISKLDYFAELGIDAIWISPFFKSPMKDFGYDVSDHRKVDDMFGTLADFDLLVDRAHALGLKVIIDQVLSHTSDQHAWFQESRMDRTNPKADWYVWADPSADGTPPNNWLAIFGGSAWEWEPRRKQYYMHNFLTSQPDLNFHNPDVPKQMLAEVEFWLKRKVDGFRLDAINFCYHSTCLKNNPVKPEETRKGLGFSVDNPYAFQYHKYDNTQPENFKFLESIRALMNRYPGRLALGEVSSEESIKTMTDYTAGNNRLHMTYSFELLVDTFTVDYIRQTVEALESELDGGLPCWSIGNHDVVRVLSRWGGDNPPDHLAKMLAALLCSLRGSVCWYQGDELGLTEADILPEQIQDPYGITFWPTFKGRDGCRTPMPWTNGDKAGFTETTPWLPVPDEHHAKSVAFQADDPQSILNNFKLFLKWRKQHSALLYGTIDFEDVGENILAIVRCHENEKIFACFNLSPEIAQGNIPEKYSVSSLDGFGHSGAKLEGQHILLQSYGVFFGTIT